MYVYGTPLNVAVGVVNVGIGNVLIKVIPVANVDQIFWSVIV